MSEKKPTAVAKTEEQLHTNPMLSMIVDGDSELKSILLNLPARNLIKRK